MKDVISLIIAGLALCVSLTNTIWTNRRNAGSARRQQAMADAQHETNTRLAGVVERMAARPNDPAGPKSVDWVAEHVKHGKRHTWLVRNLGTEVARSVSVDRDALGGVRVDILPPLPADIEPGGSVTIAALAAWGNPVANEIRLTWGDSETRTIPLPRWL